MSWAPKDLTHVQRVTRLYRRSLKHLLSWAIDRPLWREKALELRARFDAAKDVQDRVRALKLLEDGEQEFMKYRHPQPYIHPLAPGGSKFERYVKLPPHVLAMLPEEEQWYKEMTDWANGKD
eukprot:gene19093-21009_t